MSDVYDLLAQIEDMDYGPEQVALAEEAVRQADLLGDEAAGFGARMSLIRAVNMAGQAEKMFPAFAWCQDHANRHPEEVDNYTLAWYHKWVLGAALQFPQIPLSRMHELHDSYARYARRLGAGARSIPYMQLSLDMHLGDRAAARRAFTVWQWAKDDFLSDCPACEASTKVDYYAFIGDDQAAVQHGQIVLDKNLTCHSVPHTTYGAMLLPLLRLGQSERAAEYAARGRELVAGDPDFLGTQAEHLVFLALTDPEAALNWYERHVGWAEQSRELRRQLDFHAAAALLFGRLADTGQSQAGQYMVTERLAHHQAKAEALAQQFDERNGNTHCHTELTQTLGLREWQIS